MRKIFIKNNIFNSFLFLIILFIPFYQLRIEFLKPSINILSFFEIILITFGIFIYKNKLKENYENNQYFYNLILGMLAVLFIAVLKTNTFHAYGIFIEWFVLPILTGFIISIFLKEKKENVFFVKKSLLFIFVLVNLIALFYWINNNLTYDHRLKAFYLSPNYLAMFTSSLIFIVFNLFNQYKNKLYKTLLFTLILIGLIVLFKTNSLINLLAVFIGINIYLFYFYRKKFIVLASIFITISLFFISFQQKIPDFETVFKKNSGISRLVIYNVSINLIRENLFLGKNVGDFQKSYLEYQKFYFPYPEWAVPTPHNFILMNLFSGGLIFTTLFILIIVYWIFKVFVKIKKSNNENAFFYMLIMLTIIIQGLLDTPYWKNDLSLIFWLIIALGLNEE